MPDLILTELHGLSVSSITMHDYSWTFRFSDGSTLNIECPWRIRLMGKVYVSNVDQDQVYGLESPVNSAAKALSILSKNIILTAVVDLESLDIILNLKNSFLEVMPFSSGYESWNFVSATHRSMIAQGGGNLCYLP